MKKSKGRPRIFVYGTLKRDHVNSGLLARADSKWLGYDHINTSHRLVDLGAFPALVPALDGNHQTRGEVWEVNEEGLKAADMLEGHPHHYRRIKVRTVISNLKCWVYVLSEDSWMRYRNYHGWTYLNEPSWRPAAGEQDYWKLKRA